MLVWIATSGMTIAVQKGNDYERTLSHALVRSQIRGRANELP
jgi:hypothetical protein